jgi:hypothetical protein
MRDGGRRKVKGKEVGGGGGLEGKERGEIGQGLGYIDLSGGRGGGGGVGGGEEWGVGEGGGGVGGGRGNPSLKHWAGKSGSAYIFVLHCGLEPVKK